MQYECSIALIEDLITEIDNLYYTEKNNEVAEGIDKAGSVVRQLYRRLCQRI